MGSSPGKFPRLPQRGFSACSHWVLDGRSRLSPLFEVPRANPELCKSAFSSFGANKQDKLQEVLKLATLLFNPQPHPSPHTFFFV